MSDAYKSNIADAVDWLNRAGHEGQGVLRALKRGMDHGMHEFEAKMIREQFTGRPGLKRVTGTAARGWSVNVRVISDDIVAKLRNSTKYIKAFQTGEPIHAKPGKALAIPLPWVSKSLVAEGPRSIPGLFMVKRAGRPPLLARNIAGGKAIEMLFVLKKTAARPKYLHVYEDWDKHGGALVRLNMLRQLEEARRRNWR